MATTEAQARRHQLLAGAGIGVFCAVALGAAYLTGLLAPFDLRLLDLKFQLRGERTASDSIALIGVDDETIRGYGGWPLPRDAYALLLAILEDANAKAIGIDLQFPTDRNQREEWNDLLAHVSAGHENIVHATWFHARESRDAGPRGSPSDALSRHGTVSRESRIASAAAVAVPFDALLESARYLGHVSAAVDPDGGIRRVPLFVRYGERVYPSLAVTLFGVSRSLQTAPTIQPASGNTARVRWAGGPEVPVQLDREGSTSIDFAGDQQAFPNTYSMLDVLQWSRAAESDRLRATFEGKTVLLGLTSQREASEDVGATPFSIATPLVYIHANVLDNLARGRFLGRPATWMYLASIGVLGVLLGLAFARFSIPIGAALAAAVTLVVAGVLQTSLALGAVEIPSLSCLALAPLVYAGSGGYRYLFLERRSRTRELEIREGLTLQQQFLPEALVGKRISRYRIEARLGAGGMGVVYRGVADSGEPVAIKVLPGAELADERMRRRFRHEALALSRVAHPHIARLIEFDSQDGLDFIAMEFVSGESLQEKLKRGPLPEAKAVAVADQTCDALTTAHGRGILHRDLKPANVMLTDTGAVKLLDFGIARLGNVGVTMATVTGGMTESGQMLGTLPYMAPEILRGAPADERTDVYGVGVLLFEMLTGQRPYKDDRPHELMYVIVNQPPPRPSVLNARIGAELELLVLRMMAKEPGERPGGAEDVRRLLRGNVDSVTVDTGGVS